MQKSNPKYKLLHPHYFFLKMAYPISNRISTPMVAKIPSTNSGINISRFPPNSLFDQMLLHKSFQ